MKVIVIGGTGTIGTVVVEALQDSHEIVMASRSGDPRVDLVTPKLLGQVSVAIHAAPHLRNGGSITLTSGEIPRGTPGAAGGAMVNAGLEAFVRAATPDLGRGLRINAVSPGWVAETMVELGMDGPQGTPAREVARAYVDALEGTMKGEILRPGG